MLGVLPATSSMNFAQGQTVANAAFVGAGVVQQHHAVRLPRHADAWFMIECHRRLDRGTVQTPLAQAQDEPGRQRSGHPGRQGAPGPRPHRHLSTR